MKQVENEIFKRLGRRNNEMKHLEGRTPGVVDPSPFTGARVNPVPRTYACLCSGRQVRGFGALPVQGSRNIHPRAYLRGVQSLDLEALDRWYGVKRY